MANATVSRFPAVSSGADAGVRATVSSASDAIALTGLSSDTAGGYLFTFEFTATSDKAYAMEFNGGAIAAATGGSTGETAASWTLPAVALKAYVYIGVCGGAGREYVWGTARLLGKTGNRRTVEVTWYNGASAGTAQNGGTQFCTITGTGDITAAKILPQDHTAGLITAGYLRAQEIRFTA